MNRISTSKANPDNRPWGKYIPGNLVPEKFETARGVLNSLIELPEIKGAHFCDMASFSSLPAENPAMLMMARTVQCVDRIFGNARL